MRAHRCPLKKNDFPLYYQEQSDLSQFFKKTAAHQDYQKVGGIPLMHLNMENASRHDGYDKFTS